MSRRNNRLKNCEEIVDCSGRREFLVRSLFVAGGLVLSLKGMASAHGSAPEDLVVPIDKDSPLNKVGGSVTVDSAAGKVIVVRTGESTFVAFSAVCTHKRGTVEYDAAKKEFVCPKHGSTFDGSTGNVVEGPADEPLPARKATAGSGSVTVS